MPTTGAQGAFRWRVLSDQAVGRSQDDSFGIHSAFANLLYDLAQDCVTPFTVGLYSGWGTGKTSVVRMLEERISADAPRSLGYVYLDIWKYISDPLKRWVLLETERQLQEQGLVPEDYTFYGRSIESYLEFEEQWKEEGKSSIQATLALTFQRLFGFATVISALLAVALWTTEDYLPNIFKGVALLAGVIAGVGAFALILQQMFGWLLDYLRDIGFRRITWHVQAKPAFSSEKFGAIFHDIVQTAAKNLPGGKIVFVFDNLDRSPEAVAIETISVVKTYLDEPGCLYIIPCDQDAIIKHVARSYSGSDGSDEARDYAKEFLNKFFQMAFRLPAAVEFDLESFLDKLLGDAGMQDLPPAARDVLVLGYRGETPRQVKRILNDLIGYLSLATEAERKNLLNTGELTTDLPFLTKMSVISANWPEFLEKIANDPETWTAISAQLQEGKGTATDAGAPELRDFLWRTRYVSPDADIRPYLFLKRVPYERDAPLQKQVEAMLRNGDLRQFEKGLEMSAGAGSLQSMLDMSVSVVRRWRTTNHQPLVANAAPLMVRAAAMHTGNRELVQESLHVLELFSASMSPVQLEATFDPPDVFKIVADATVQQRRNILTRYTAPFAIEGAPTDARKRVFVAFLANGGLVDEQVKVALSQWIRIRYENPSTEQTYLDLIALAAEAADQNSWLATPRLLTAIAERVQFEPDDLDRKRIRVLICFQDSLPSDAGAKLVAQIARLVPSSPAKPPGAQLPIITEALAQLKPTSLRNVEAAAVPLLDQLNAHALQEKAPWVKPLAAMRASLSEDLSNRFAQAIKASFIEIGNPTALQTYLGQLGEDELKKLLELSGAPDAIREEAKLFESSFGLPAASAHRQNCLSHLPLANLVTDLSLYDLARSWDVVIYIGNVERALQAAPLDGSTVSIITAHLTRLASNFPAAEPQANRPIFDALCSVTDNHPDLVNSDLAKALADRAIDYLAVPVDEDYRVFRKCLARMSPGDKTTYVRQLENRCLRESSGDRTKLLANITEDVCSDPEVRANEALIAELFDFAYRAALGHPASATDSLLRLSEYLAETGRANYLVRALDHLLYLESGPGSVDEMEPFLRLLTKLKHEIKGEAAEKLGRFLKRMLSPASERQRKFRAIDLAADLQLPALLELVRPDLEVIAASEDADLASKAAKIINA